jgi:hypothetical protein
MVRELAPFEDHGIPAAYATVVNKYLTSVKWQERVQSKELAFVDVIGKLNDVDGSPLEAALTFRVTPWEGRTENMFWIEPHTLEIGGRHFGWEAAEEFVNDLFSSYDGGFNNIADYYLSHELDDGILQFFIDVFR